MKHRCTEALQRSQLWDRGHLSRQDFSRWGWRLSSSWGKPGQGWANQGRSSNGAEKDEKDTPTNLNIKVDGEDKIHFGMDGKDMMRRFEAIRQELEKDPYTAIFGTRMQRNVFSLGWFKDAPYHSSSDKTPPRPRTTERPNGSVGLPKAGKNDTTTERKSTGTFVAKHKPDVLNQGANTHYEGVASEPSKSDNDYDIDPITLRKVWPKKPCEQYPQVSDPVYDSSVDIPVKPLAGRGEKSRGAYASNASRPGKNNIDEVVIYKDNGSKAPSATQPRETSSGQGCSPHTAKDNRSFVESRSEPTNRSSQEWLVQEGFGQHLDRQRTRTETSKQSSNEPAPFRPSNKTSLIQTEQGYEPKRLSYDVNESKAEDLDLLRSSDVRAASGIIRRPRRETALQRQWRRKQLERDFRNNQTDLGLLREEAMPGKGLERANKILGDIKVDKSDLKGEVSSVFDTTDPSLGTSATKQLENRVQHQEILHAADLQAREAAKPRSIYETHKDEAIQRRQQPQAADLLGEGDMSANVSEFVNRARWYKNKAPHASQSVQLIKSQVDVTEEQSQGLLEKTDTNLPTKSEPHVPANAGVMRGSDDAVSSGLREYEEKIGPLAYKFGMGSDTLEADLIKQSEDRSLCDSLQVDSVPGSPDDSMSETQCLSRKASDRSMEWLTAMTIRRSQLISTRIEESRMTLCWVREELDKIKNDRSSRLASLKSGPGAMYKILAYDWYTGKMTTADTTSSHGRKEKALSPSSVLLRINRPTKFFPYITSMQADGYEIVSGKDDMLVFQKMRDATVALPGTSSNTEPEPFANQTQPLMASTQDQSQRGTSATSSPSPIVNTTVFPPPLSQQPSPKPSAASASNKVTREEDVFSASSRKWQDTTNHNDNTSSKKGGIRKAGRRVLWVGIWTAGCAYAVGVVAEYFRTGGANGLGPQGF
ncbi:MAG: hypothetical protein M1812_003077 [Candelaria pacifica]|nr:MAG: hypothetical protein M1812_003077 [Candelaria pacifica]